MCLLRTEHRANLSAYAAAILGVSSFELVSLINSAFCALNAIIQQEVVLIDSHISDKDTP